MMKVLLVSSNFPPEIGGPAASIEYISKILESKGIKNSILTNGTNKKYNDSKNVVRTKFVKYKKHSLIGAFLRMYYLFFKLIKVGKDFDLFHSQDVNVSGFPTMLAAKILKKQYIVKFSGDMYIEYQLRKNKTMEYALNSNNLIKSTFNFIQKIICNNSKITIATSNYVKNYLLNIGVKENKITLIPNGVISQKIDNSIVKKVKAKYGNNIICSSCRITKIKGIELLINSAKKLLEYNFVIFGEGKDKEYFEKLISEKNIKNFFFYGKVSHKKIQSYIKASKIFVLASYYEPFGIAILDAMYANKPILVSDAGGMKEIVKNNTGLVFKSGNVQDFIDKISKIRKINLNQQKVEIKKYYWENIVNLYQKEYEK